MLNKKQDVIEFVKNNDINNFLLKEIGLILNINERTVRTHLKTLKIKKKPLHVEKREKKKLIEKLISEGLIQSEIAKKMSLTRRQVTTLCYNYSLKNNNKFIIEVNDIEYQVFLASVLGDGHIDRGGRLRLRHGSKQSEYLKYKINLLEKNKVSLVKYDVLRFDKRTKKTYSGCILDTITNEYFRLMRKRWYNDTSKTIDFKELESLNELGLSIWFMDDGYKYNAAIGIATNCFSDSEILKLKTFFYNKFKINFHIKKEKQLVLLKNDYPRFHELISDLIIPSMKYKLQII